MTEAIIELFWETATQMIVLVVPVIGITLIFKLIGEALFKEK